MQVIRRRKFDEWHDASLIFVTHARVGRGAPIDTDVPRLVHDVVWSDRSLLTFTVDHGAPFVVAPGHLAWLPALSTFTATSSANGVAHMLSFWSDYCLHSWPLARSVPITPLAREVLGLLASEPDCPEVRYHAERLLLATVRTATAPATPLALPTDHRAREVAESLLADPSDPRTLAEWGRAVGASARTLARHFATSTGRTFPEWRRAARIHAAVDQLHRGRSVTAAARAVGYTSTSAFIHAFRHETGVTPRGLAEAASAAAPSAHLGPRPRPGGASGGSEQSDQRPLEQGEREVRRGLAGGEPSAFGISIGHRSSPSIGTTRSSMAVPT